MLTRYLRRLLFGAMALIAFASTMAPSAAAQAPVTFSPTPQPTRQHWPGWALRVTFPKDPATGQQVPQVIYTVYTFVAGPPVQVVDSIQEDISNECTTHGALLYDGTYAIFDGTSTYIECNVPAWRDMLAQIDPTHPGANPNRDSMTCAAGSPASGAAEVKVASGTRGNPLIDASNLGIALSLPADRGQAATRLRVHPNTYSSPQWNLEAGGNRVVIGMDGPAMVAFDNHFKWMPYLDPSWKPWFEANIVGPEIGHKDEPSNTTWQGPAGGYELRTTAATVYIGRNVSGTNYFKGRLADGIVDPPCKSG